MKEVFDSWFDFMKDIIYDDTVLSNLNTINMYYKYVGEKGLIHPKQENVFKAFKECPYSKLSVVILGQDPYHDGSATGLAFANLPPKNNERLSPSLRVIEDTISRTVYHNHDFSFNPDLTKWAKQGVLLLNTALTVETGHPLSHLHLWNNFTTMVLAKLSEINSSIIYCLWGKHADSYSMYINSNSNTILRCNHPAYAVYQGIPWECDHFVKINIHLKDFNNTTITW
jgi:uracil-DNA glycosylase